jgi:hypothetical protein
MSWKPSPEVVISSGRLGTPIDFINQFSIADKRFTELRVVLKPARRHKLRFSTIPIKYSGRTTLNQRITFKGQTYNVGVETSSELKWTLMRGGYEWDPIASNLGFAGIFVDVKYNQMHAQLTAPAPAGTQAFDRNVPVPTAGGIVRGYLTRYVSLTGEATAVKLNRSTFNAKLYDFDVYGIANFGRYVGAQFGYRSITVDYVVDEDTGNLKLKGPYFGGVVRF